MEKANTTSQLRYHAGLDQQEKLSSPSLADVLWRKESTQEALEDVLRILQALNIEMNGEIPSESSNREQHFSRALIYAVSETIRLVRHSANEAPNDALRNDLDKSARRIEMAWSAVLAGDIDNLKNHITEEEAAHEG